MLGCKPTGTPINQNHQLGTITEGILVEKGRYQKLVGRLIYLSHTRPNIAYVVSMVSQFMHSPLKSHIDAVLRILRYLSQLQEKVYCSQKTITSELRLTQVQIGQVLLLIGDLLQGIVLLWATTWLFGEEKATCSCSV